MAELALAIVPLCFAAIKGTRVVLKRLKILRQHNIEIKRLQKKFRTQTDNFLDECQTFLQELLDDYDLAEELVKDDTHPMWNTVQLDNQIKNFLGRRTDRFEEIMNDIHEKISGLDMALNSVSLDTKLKGLENTKGAIDVMLKRTKYDSWIDQFKESIHELKNVRKIPDGSFRIVVRYRTRSAPHHYLVDLLVRSESIASINVSISRTLYPASEEKPRAKKVKKVRFDDDCTASSTSKRTSSTIPLNLSSSKDLCEKVSARCGGYLDTPGYGVRHHLSPVCDDYCKHKDCINEKALGTPVPLGNVFGYSVEQSISVPQQLRLALRLVNGILQFASTSCLQDLWCVQDISYFTREDSLVAALTTMHISSELSQEARREVSMPDLAITDEFELAQRTYGVGNTSLYSLGKALLQIGQWSLLMTDDIGEIRRLAECDSRLGPVYQRITQQCLDCNFASSKDLGDPDLQNAIYRDVVCGLEGIIKSLEGR
ncbi:hypothetical protein PGQ11_009241 [Apiospora arundinis]|uniref:DUF7580 domain-containing protein n=1 Tax=Apiospora arundinis TaxID=335852 RepID=A0ABR2IHF9_9PEZI